ncbi:MULTISPECIES: hypothetical protein [Burkholderia]|nr:MULTISPECIES: hypothetical protein [Burkholderia]
MNPGLFFLETFACVFACLGIAYLLGYAVDSIRLFLEYGNDE